MATKKTEAAVEEVEATGVDTGIVGSAVVSYKLNDDGHYLVNVQSNYSFAVMQDVNGLGETIFITTNTEAQKETLKGAIEWGAASVIKNAVQNEYKRQNPKAAKPTIEDFNAAVADRDALRAKLVAAGIDPDA